MRAHIRAAVHSLSEGRVLGFCPLNHSEAIVAADVPASDLFILTTSNNAESMCTAQGALLASYASSTSPKAFYQSDYATCSLASRGTCADYNSHLTADLPACSPQITASSYAVASLYATGAQPCSALFKHVIHATPHFRLVLAVNPANHRQASFASCHAIALGRHCKNNSASAVAEAPAPAPATEAPIFAPPGESAPSSI